MPAGAGGRRRGGRGRGRCGAGGAGHRRDGSLGGGCGGAGGGGGRQRDVRQGGNRRFRLFLFFLLLRPLRVIRRRDGFGGAGGPRRAFLGACGLTHGGGIRRTGLGAGGVGRCGGIAALSGGPRCHSSVGRAAAPQPVMPASRQTASPKDKLLRNVYLMQAKSFPVSKLNGYSLYHKAARSAALLSSERPCPFRGGPMFSQPSEILDFRLRREVIIPHHSPFCKVYSAIVQFPAARLPSLEEIPAKRPRFPAAAGSGACVTPFTGRADGP